MKNNIVSKYYFAGSTRLAVRTDGTLRFLLGDHLGSSSVTTNANGAKTASALYKAFGESRFTSGTLYTDYKFTGQREEASLGIYFFVARWFDPSLGRFLSPDSIIPPSQGTQAYDRYTFVNNNPVRYTDPTGHMCREDGKGCDGANNHAQSLEKPPVSGICSDKNATNYGAEASCIYPVQHALPESHTINSYHAGEANQQQTGRDDCGPTSIAMATSLYTQSCGASGDQVQSDMESVSMKPPFFGVPTWDNGFFMLMGIRMSLPPGANVAYVSGASLYDLRSGIAGDSIVIVVISNDTNSQILQQGFASTVGHYMVAVSYDSHGFTFLDPASGGSRNYTNHDFENTWIVTSNTFIAPGSMWVITTP